MTRTFWRRVSWPILFAGLSAPALMNCGGGMPGLPGGLPGVPGGKCPDMTKVEAIESFDWQNEFKLDAKASGSIKAGASAAAEIKGMAEKVEADLKTACTKLSTDLGGASTYDSAEAACNGAVKAMGDLKAKIGASASYKLVLEEPKCGADLKVMGDCAASCDATIKPGSVKVDCQGGELSGGCSGQCSGSCEASAAAACSGECNGSCDAEISGTCSGQCQGKCDGQVMNASANGQCAGKCDGKCTGNVKGTCKGKCGGSCKMSASASCQGTCTGKCSVDFQEPKCTGKVVPPQMSAECKAKCDAKVSAKVSCTPPHVAFVIAGAADAQAAAKLRAAMEGDLGMILNVAIGIGKRIGDIAGEMKVVVDGVTAAEGQASGAMKIGLTACIAPVLGVMDAVGKVQASVKVSVNVQASASASGSASGKAGG
jgi:hypothetical protein